LGNELEKSEAFMTVLETDRLRLRPFVLDDFEDHAAMVADPEVMQFLGDGKPLPRFAAWRTLCSIVGHWGLRGYGMFAVMERSTGRFVGCVGPVLFEGWLGFEMLWTLRSEDWGKGYATEAVARCLEHAFIELRQPHVISLIAPENLRSIRVAERVGQRLERDVELPDSSGKVVRQYGLSRDEWMQLQVSKEDR
jgi:RimJ/RimL family protein N-acetyltransferase